MKLFSDEYRRRERWFRYTINPWMSLLALVTATILTAIYHPPFTGTVVTIAGALLGGVFIAYGPVSRHRWMEKQGVSVPLVTVILVNMHYGFQLDGRFFSLIAWMGFGMGAPFWIWRKKGIETYSHADASKPGWHLN